MSRIEKEMADLKSKADKKDADMKTMQKQLEGMSVGLNNLTSFLMGQNGASKPASSQGAAAGSDY